VVYREKRGSAGLDPPERAQGVENANGHASENEDDERQHHNESERRGEIQAGNEARRAVRRANIRALNRDSEGETRVGEVRLCNLLARVARKQRHICEASLETSVLRKGYCRGAGVGDIYDELSGKQQAASDI